ncbi:Permease of the drug/metabolite transporter (DMT) superfamily [Halopenitus malekzadehii]|uniref:Permease of the drug/metabolite transporter (DMT) superfamily n=1 Tax=Halopenitus malekzadehii TaxID=1267564 RepID=A0A1H6IRV3_9EURY|nr:EamA family transporter [Halopenitus malekzadehii]SEH52418.1 Permease of the drug/metabolite transporter (DMT) superfamily [Halopenitus malekzadehii]
MRSYRNLLLFLLLATLWGSAFMTINAGLEYFPPVLFAAFRYDVAAVVMLGYAVLIVDDPIPRTRGEWTLVAIGGVLLIAAYHVFLFIGESDPHVTSAVAAVIVSLSPVLTTVFARGFLPEERLTIVGTVGLLFGLGGVIVLTNPDPGSLLGDGAVPKLLVFLAAASFALGTVLTRTVDAQLPIETMEAWSMLIGAAIMHIVSIGLGESVGDVVWSFEAILALGYLSIAASAIGFLVFFDLLERLGPIEINLVSYVAPVFAALSGWVFLDEIITIATVLGFLLIFCGFLLVKREAIRAEIVRYRSTG